MQAVERDNQGHEARIFLCFEMHPKKDEEKSTAEGRPVYTDMEYIKIRAPGERDVVHRPVSQSDKQRFAQAYRAWKDGTSDASVTGTPLSEWPGCTRSQVEEMAYFGIRTVEALASVTDGNVKNVGPILALRQKAKDYLEAARANAPAEQMRAELAKRDNDIDVLRRQVEELTKLLETKTKPTKKTTNPE
jgi:hypothetical protein